MKQYKRWEEVQTIQRQEIERIVCDWCGGEIVQKKDYSTRDLAVSFTDGASYGVDGGYKEGWEVEDLCDNCVKKLRALLESQGIRISKVEIDW